VKSFEVPASVTALSFLTNRSVEVVTFARGAQIRRLGSSSFTALFSLREICIPASVEFIGKCCFCGASPSQLRTVTFAPESNLREIEAWAFADCDELFDIEIPSSVTRLGRGCFAKCRSLPRVSFCASSRLESIPKEAFRGCRSLDSVDLPPSVKTLEPECFEGCASLVYCPWRQNSGVVRIGDVAFRDCQSLVSMFLPSSVEFVGVACFSGCNSLSRLTFGLPSNLRELRDLPPALVGFVEIPDSVEILRLIRTWNNQSRRTLDFGPDSRLRDIGYSRDPFCRRRPIRSFLRVSIGSLKVFRATMEFTRSTWV
jgi:hypothetical protein